jgi:hypothetical protein
LNFTQDHQGLWHVNVSSLFGSARRFAASPIAHVSHFQSRTIV